MAKKRGVANLIGAAALALGAGILLTFLLSARAMIPVLSLALIVSGVAFFLGSR